MSYYYKYNFVSPEPQYATVKEELKSYFDSGAVDDLMFPTYLKKALDKLGKGTYSIVDSILHIEDYQSRLPDNFYAIREAWLCTAIDGFPFQSPNSFYSQAASETTIQVTPMTSNGLPCSNLNCSGCGECMPTLIQAVYKTNNEVNVLNLRKNILLTPGNIATKNHCTQDCINFGASGPDTFDIRDNKFVTNFKCGKVYLLAYVTSYDDLSNQMIPDNYRIKEFIEAFLKYKVFETLSNQVNDETFNQIQQKLLYYEQKMGEAYILAESEMKKQTAYEKQRAIIRQKNSFNKYELPGGGSRRIFRRR